LAKPEEKLAGIRFDPTLFAPSQLDYATSLVLQHLAIGSQQLVELPINSEGIRYIRFHPTKSYFVFVSKVRNEAVLELYKCMLNVRDGDRAGAIGKWTMQKLPLFLNSEGDERRMNFVYGCAYQFLEDGSDRLLVKVVPKDWPTKPPAEPVSTGPAIQVVSKDARKAPGRTYQGELI
jgi:hypothetical protein